MTKTRQLVVVVRGLLSIATLLLVVVEPVLAQETNVNSSPTTSGSLPIKAKRFIFDGWFPGGDTSNPAEQDKRMQILPGSLASAIKTLREREYRTSVSELSQKDKGNGLSDARLSVSCDAGYLDSDGYTDYSHVNYVTLLYKRKVTSKKPDAATPPKVDPNKAINEMPYNLDVSLRDLMNNEKFEATRVRVPGFFNSSTELTLRRIQIPENVKDTYVIETLELERAMYTHASPRRDPGDQYPNPRDPQDPRR